MWSDLAGSTAGRGEAGGVMASGGGKTLPTSRRCGAPAVPRKIGTLHCYLES